jgi:hypothetical protein
MHEPGEPVTGLGVALRDKGAKLKNALFTTHLPALGQILPPSVVPGGDGTCSDGGRGFATQRTRVGGMLAVLTNKENDHAGQRSLSRTHTQARSLEQG